MSEPLSLQQLADHARVLERHMADGKIGKDAQALRDRIEQGYGKIVAAGLPGDDERIVKAQAKVAELEDQLARTERQIEMPHYFEQALLIVMRDALKWSSVPAGSRIRVMLPNVLDITVKLDNLPEQAPF